MLERQFVFFQPQIWKSESQIIQETFSKLDSMVKWRKQLSNQTYARVNWLISKKLLVFQQFCLKSTYLINFLKKYYPTRWLLAAPPMMCPMASHTCRSFISLDWDLVKMKTLVQSLRVGPWDSAFMIHKLPDDLETAGIARLWMRGSSNPWVTSLGIDKENIT